LVTQATVSRDLDDLGATKVRNEVGQLAYAIHPAQAFAEDPLSRVARMAQDLLVSAEPSANLVVLHTPPGGSQLLASALDNAISTGALPEIIGTVAGDDTVLVITRSADGGVAAASHILRLADRQEIHSAQSFEPNVGIQEKHSEGKRS